MSGNRHLYGVKMIYNMKKSKTLLEIIDLSDQENILQNMEWSDKFPCTGCGSCCKRIDKLLPNIEKLDDNLKQILNFPYTHINGRCEKLGNDNKCTIYEDRPIVCSYEKFMEVFNYSKDDIFPMSIASCNKMMDEDGVGEEFRIKIN